MAKIISTAPPGAVQSSATRTSAGSGKPSGPIHSGAVSAASMATRQASTMPLASRPRALSASSSAARSTCNAWSRPNTAMMINNW